jgi:hypothetical protein
METTRRKTRFKSNGGNTHNLTGNKQNKTTQKEWEIQRDIGGHYFGRI